DTPYAEGVYVQDSLAYVADHDSGLRIIDVSSPSSPKEVGFYDTPYAEGVYVQDSLAYVADWESGLRIIDVSSPSSPKEVGFYDTPYAEGVYVQDSLAYVADDLGGLIILRYTGGEPAGAINGHVTDLVGNPIKFALVIAIKKPAKATTFTDKDGYYEMPDLQVGEWLVICIKRRYKAGFAKVIVEAGKTTTKDFKLRPKLREDEEDELTFLYENYPNPFNPETWIPYQIAQDANVTISIYNVKGRLIRVLHLGEQKAVIYVSKDRAAYWDGRDSAGETVGSGVYFYTLQVGDFKATRRMVILKTRFL
ncbi:MAG: carboxypeptidase regulatory-like domain-containing protein, partial [Candidatus Poribacteria bacterium]